MSVLLDLPRDLIVSLVSDWLVDTSLQSLFRLDVALTHDAQCSQFLEALRIAPVSFSVKSVRTFPWMAKREVMVSGLFLNGSTFVDNKFGSSVEKIKSFFSALICFRALKSLDFSYYASLFHRFEPSALMNLTSLAVTRSDLRDDLTELQLIKDHCRKLTSLTLRVHPKSFAFKRHALICDIIDLNPFLVSLELTLGDTSVLAHFLHCKHLKKLHLNVIWIDGGLVNAFIENSQIDEFFLNSNLYVYSYQSENRVSTLEFGADEEQPNIADIFNQYKRVKRVMLSFPTTVDLLNTLHTCCPNIEGLSIARMEDDGHEIVRSALQLFPALKQFCLYGYGAYSFPLEEFCSGAKFQHLEDLTLAYIGMTFPKWLTIITAYPKLTKFLLYEKFDNEFVGELAGFFEQNTQAVGRQFLFEYNHGNKTFVKYENCKISTSLLDTTDSDSDENDSNDSWDVSPGESESGESESQSGEEDNDADEEEEEEM